MISTLFADTIHDINIMTRKEHFMMTMTKKIVKIMHSGEEPDFKCSVIKLLKTLCQDKYVKVSRSEGYLEVF